MGLLSDISDLFFSVAMKKMASSNVLIVGVQGLGVEIGAYMRCQSYSYPTNLRSAIAKNIVLAGVKSVTIYDPEPISLEDLGTQV